MIFSLSDMRNLIDTRRSRAPTSSDYEHIQKDEVASGNRFPARLPNTSRRLDLVFAGKIRLRRHVSTEANLRSTQIFGQPLPGRAASDTKRRTCPIWCSIS